MIAFIDDHRCVYGVGPICRVVGIAPSTFYASKAVERDPDLASDRARQDRLDMDAIKQAFDGSRGRYGARKVWHQLRREGARHRPLHSGEAAVRRHGKLALWRHEELAPSISQEGILDDHFDE